MTEIYIALAAGAGAFLTKLVDWIFSRKSSREDVREKEIKNEIQLSEYYKSMLDDLSQRYEQKYTDIVALYESKEKILREEIALLRRENRLLKKQLGEKEREIKALRKANKELELRA